MPVLIVVSHPDDEALGCGGTAARLAAEGIDVYSCILAVEAQARHDRPEVPELIQDMLNAHRLLGVRDPIMGEFPNMDLNRVPHLDLVQFIEEAMVKTQADVIFTHHPHDLNNDHYHTSLACQAAARFFQRQPGKLPRLKALYFMEILSSTDWAFSGRGEFRPDTYFEIEDTLEKKIEALQAYRGIMRPFPHPRSPEILRGLAAYRGGQAGLRYAEAFQTAFRALTPQDLGG
jgi:LmbE family N-acetylglucosaminyl deacetylase